MKTITVSRDEYGDTIRTWAQRGMHITAQNHTWTVLERPTKPKRTVGRALLLTLVTVGLYPVAWIVYWFLFAWWIIPLRASRRPQRITITYANY
jgi:hypothetical protein